MFIGESPWFIALALFVRGNFRTRAPPLELSTRRGAQRDEANFDGVQLGCRMRISDGFNHQKQCDLPSGKLTVRP